VENKLPTALIGQRTHEDLIKKIGLRRILFDTSCLRRIVFHLKSGLRRTLLIKKLIILFLIIRGCILFEVFYAVYQFISGEDDLNSNSE